jgi:endonuclease YncB( thermonuclease family)
MKPKIVILYLILLVGATSASALAQTLSGRVFRVISGDQLVLIDPENALHTVRLAGIQAPQVGRPFGADARTHLRTLLLGRFTLVDYKRRDSAKRILGKVTYGGADVNLRQIQAGLARFRADHGLKDRERSLYLQAERRAREAGQGMWRGSISRMPAGQPR